MALPAAVAHRCVDNPLECSFNRNKFFSGYRIAFGPLRQDQVDGIEFLLGTFEKDSRWADLRHVAYALATCKHETDDTFQPVEEVGGKTYLSKYYLKPRLRQALGNVQLSDSWVFKGRSYVQITGRRNYILFAKKLGIPLVENPDLALQPEAAFQIMTIGFMEGLFTGKKISHYINDQKTDYFNARRCINGTDRAGLIKEFAQKFERCLS